MPTVTFTRTKSTPPVSGEVYIVVDSEGNDNVLMLENGTGRLNLPTGPSALIIRFMGAPSSQVDFKLELPSGIKYARIKIPVGNAVITHRNFEV